MSHSRLALAVPKRRVPVRCSVVQTVNGKDYAQKLRVDSDQLLAARTLAAEEEKPEPVKPQREDDD